jgi:membrane-associated phospholipid phosphatase
MKMQNQIIDAGKYGPGFMVIIAVWQLYYLPKYLLWFFVFLWINESIIIFAKKIIQQPRPGQTVLPDSQNADYGYYGMPSGHAQHAGFIMMFLWLVNPSWVVLCIYVVITGITILQRYTAKLHTLEQLFVGGILGSLVAYVSVMIMRKYYEYN